MPRGVPSIPFRSSLTRKVRFLVLRKGQDTSTPIPETEGLATEDLDIITTESGDTIALEPAE